MNSKWKKIMITMPLSLILFILCLYVSFYIPFEKKLGFSSLMKSLSVEIARYGSEKNHYHAGCGILTELPKTSPLYISPNATIGEEAMSIFYIGATDKEDSYFPITLVQLAEPHWFFQGFLHQHQYCHIGLSDGSLEVVCLSPDVKGIKPVLLSSSSYSTLSNSQKEIIDKRIERYFQHDFP